MNKTTNQTQSFNSWILEMPQEIAEKEGFSIGSRVVLTFDNGNLKTEIIPPISDEKRTEVNRLIKKYDKTFQKLKENGE